MNSTPTSLCMERPSDATKLAQSLKAYQNAEKGGPSGDGRAGGGGIGDSPDLHFNRAIVHRYVEEYGAALEGFRRAAALDPALPWRAEVRSTHWFPFDRVRVVNAVP